MAEARLIACEECPSTYETVRKNTKICGKCRLLKNLTFIGTKYTRKCDLCPAVFAPLERGETTCGGCIYQPKKHGETTCFYCKEVRLRVRGDVGICHVCARKPEYRTRIIQSLRDGLQNRKALAHGQA